MRIRRTDGVTLIELLVVTVILSVVSLAIYSSFASGLKVWKRVNTAIEGEDLALFFERFAQDLRSTALLNGNLFTATEDRVEIPVVTGSRRMGLSSTVGRVTYVFPRDAGAVTRSEQDYSALFVGKGADEPRVALGDIADHRLSFYCFDAESGRYVWVDKWAYSRPPLAVRLELRRAGQGEQDTVRRTFDIPVAGTKYE